MIGYVPDRWDQLLGELYSIRVTLATLAENVRHQGTDITEIRADIDNNAHRIGVLERWKWTVVGAAAAAGIAFTPIFQAVAR